MNHTSALTQSKWQGTWQGCAKSILAILFLLLTSACTTNPAHNASANDDGATLAADAGQRDGEIRSLSDGSWQSWDAVVGLWLAPQKFWESYAARGPGHYWGRLTELPNYQRSREFDTFIFETPQGSCLMEFFHQRWRRANDVRRWDERYNQYSGCGQVFNQP